MTSIRFAVLAAGLALAAAECDVCHLHYYHKEVSTKEVFGADVTQCREYQSESCCTPKTAKNVNVDDYLYGKDYNHNACGQVSSKCQKFFVEEACFYECDKNMGKWRKHDDCSDKKPGDNGWEIAAMPIKASYCDAWYEACKDDPVCPGPTKSYFDMSVCIAKVQKDNNTAAHCKKYKDVYANGKEICEVMWGGSFKYEADEKKDAYVMAFPEGTENPNNKVFTDKAYPPICEGQEVNVTHPHVHPDDHPEKGKRLTAEEAGCPADWHKFPDSGHPMNGTTAKYLLASKSGASSGRSSFAAVAAILVSVAVMFLA